MLVITASRGAQSLIQWAGRLARARSQKLTVVCCEESGEEAGDGLKASWESATAPPGLDTEAAVAEIIQSRFGDSVDLQAVSGLNPRQALLEKAAALGSRMVIIGMQGTAASERLGRQLFNVPDFDTMLLDPGSHEEHLPERILVPMAGSFAPRALSLALEMAGPQGMITPFLVSPEFGVDSRAVARQELRRMLDELGVSTSQRVVPQIGIDGEAAQGIARAAADCRLVILGSRNPAALAKIQSMRAQHAESDRGAKPAIALIRPMTVTAENVWSRMLERIRRPFARLGPTERINLFDRLQPGVGISTDFIVMMTLSTSIAAMGLLSNSTAEVIGAMLVAPLMTPLIGAGFGLVQGNSRLFGKAMRSMVLGIFTGLLFAVLIGLLFPKETITVEMIIRSQPDLLDFAVALLSGAAAAYAFARPGLMGTLAGVAIAAALVPPLATVGIALARGVAFVALGAAVLHVTNLVAITLGAALIFYLLGVHGTRSLISPLAWTRRGTILLALASLCLMSFLVYKTITQQVQGQTRPLAFPVSDAVYRAARERIEKEPGMQLIIAARSGFIEDRNEVYFLLASDRPVNPDLNRDLRQILKEMLGAETRTQIYIVRSAAVMRGEEPDTPGARRPEG